MKSKEKIMNIKLNEKKKQTKNKMKIKLGSYTKQNKAIIQK